MQTAGKLLSELQWRSINSVQMEAMRALATAMSVCSGIMFVQVLPGTGVNTFAPAWSHHRQQLKFSSSWEFVALTPQQCHLLAVSSSVGAADAMCEAGRGLSSGGHVTERRCKCCYSVQIQVIFPLAGVWLQQLFCGHELGHFGPTEGTRGKPDVEKP